MEMVHCNSEVAELLIWYYVNDTLPVITRLSPMVFQKHSLSATWIFLGRVTHKKCLN